MPIWAWILIFVGIALAGLGLHLTILFGIKYKAQRTMAVVAPIQQKISQFQEQLATKSDYQAPANNLGDDPVVSTQIWLKRQHASEQRKAARQRRLISRLTKRK
jgi:hypothetical protein